MHVLRKGYKQWSAGTRVDVVPGGGFAIFDLDIPDALVVKRRSMTAVVPLINSRARRKQTKLAKQIVLGMVGGAKGTDG